MQELTKFKFLLEKLFVNFLLKREQIVPESFTLQFHATFRAM